MKQLFTRAAMPHLPSLTSRRLSNLLDAWHRRNPREQKMLLGMALALGILAAVWLFLPARLVSLDQARAEVVARAERLAQVEQLLQSAGQRPAVPDLAGTVTAAFEQAGLNVSTNIPGDPQQLQVRLAASRFDTLLGVLGSLQNERGIRVLQLDLTRSADRAGLVGGDLTLTTR